MIIRVTQGTQKAFLWGIKEIVSLFHFLKQKISNRTYFEISYLCCNSLAVGLDSWLRFKSKYLISKAFILFKEIKYFVHIINKLSMVFFDHVISFSKIPVLINSKLIKRVACIIGSIQRTHSIYAIVIVGLITKNKGS